jgi:hypothetical protein
MVAIPQATRFVFGFISLRKTCALVGRRRGKSVPKDYFGTVVRYLDFDETQAVSLAHKRPPGPTVISTGGQH